MSCQKIGSYDEQRLAKKKYLRKKACQFKTNFIALWEKYGEFQDVNGVRCFAGYRIDGDGEGQKKMSKRLMQKDLWDETDDKHFDWVKLYFNLGKLNTVTSADVDAFFTYYKNESHGKDADRLHLKLEKVQEPNDYGYYTTNRVVTEHWFDKKIVTITQDADGNDVETITWEKIEDSEFLDELAWELGDLALDSAVWFDDETLQEITEIVTDTELTQVELDDRIDELRATEFGTDETVYKVVTMGDKIQEYTIEQTVGDNILDDLEYVSYYGEDGQYYLSVDAAKKMNCIVFMEIVGKLIDFRSKLKSKYKWRKRLLAIVVIVGSVILIASGNVGAGVSLLSSYVGSISHSSTIKIITQAISLASGGVDISSMGAGEAMSLILNVAGLYYQMQENNQPPKDEPIQNDDLQQMFYKTPYSLYDDIYCFNDLIQVNTL